MKTVFILLSNKQSLSVFFLQCSHLQLSANIALLPEWRRRGESQGFAYSQDSAPPALILSPPGLRDLHGPFTILLSPLSYIYYCSISPSDYQGSCSPHTSTNKPTFSAYYPGCGRRRGTDTKRECDLPKTFQQMGNRLQIRALVSSLVTLLFPLSYVFVWVFCFKIGYFSQEKCAG